MESAWSPLLPGSGTQRMRIVLEDLRHQRGPPAAAEHAAASQQHLLLGPGFLVGALQAFAERGMLGVRSARVQAEATADEAPANVQQSQASKAATRVAADGGAAANRQQGTMLRQNSRRKDVIIEVEVEVHAPAACRDKDFSLPSELPECGSPSPPRFSLPQERFCSLFPFHILLDSDGMLVQVSVCRPSFSACFYGLTCRAGLSFLPVCGIHFPFIGASARGQLAACLQGYPRHQGLPCFSAFQGGTPNVWWGCSSYHLALYRHCSHAASLNNVHCPPLPITM